MRDIVGKGIERLADPGGDQVKILVAAAGQEGRDGQVRRRPCWSWARSGHGPGLRRAVLAPRANLALFDIEDGTLETAAAGSGSRLPWDGQRRRSQTADVEAAVARTVERFAGIDVLVHTAAWSSLTPLLEFPESVYAHREELTGVFLTVKAAGRVMADVAAARSWCSRRPTRSSPKSRTCPSQRPGAAW